MDGYVQLVTVRVFEFEELGGDAAGFERRQAEIGADAVFGVDDGRAGHEVIELADDGLGIPLGPLAARFLPRSLAE